MTTKNDQSFFEWSQRRKGRQLDDGQNKLNNNQPRYDATKKDPVNYDTSGGNYDFNNDALTQQTLLNNNLIVQDLRQSKQFVLVLLTPFTIFIISLFFYCYIEILIELMLSHHLHPLMYFGNQLYLKLMELSSILLDK